MSMYKLKLLKGVRVAITVPNGTNTGETKVNWDDHEIILGSTYTSPYLQKINILTGETKFEFDEQVVHDLRKAKAFDKPGQLPKKLKIDWEIARQGKYGSMLN